MAPPILPAGVDEAGRDARFRTSDAREARDGHGRTSCIGAAEHECREQVPEALAVEWQPGEERHGDRRGEEPAGQRGADSDAPDDDRATFDATTTVSAKARNAMPVCTAE